MDDLVRQRRQMEFSWKFWIEDVFVCNLSIFLGGRSSFSMGHMHQSGYGLATSACVCRRKIFLKVSLRRPVDLLSFSTKCLKRFVLKQHHCEKKRRLECLIFLEPCFFLVAPCDVSRLDRKAGTSDNDNLSFLLPKRKRI